MEVTGEVCVLILALQRIFGERRREHTILGLNIVPIHKVGYVRMITCPAKCIGGTRPTTMVNRREVECDTGKVKL